VNVVVFMQVLVSQSAGTRKDHIQSIGKRTAIEKKILARPHEREANRSVCNAWRDLAQADRAPSVLDDETQ
jgi:hypothetical protein